MINMKKISALFLLGLAFNAHAEQLRIGVSADYPPFASFNEKTGDMEGFDIDIAKAICKDLKATCSIQNIDFDQLIPSLNQNKIDVIISSLSITEDRKKEVLFTNKYYDTPSKFVIKNNSKFSLATEDLNKQTIGVQKDSVQEKFIKKYYSNSGLNIKSYDKSDDIFKDLKNNVINMTFSDTATEPPSGFNFVGTSYSARTNSDTLGYGAAFALRKSDETLKNILNNSINNIRKNGEYNKIQKMYFKRDIY